MKVVATIFNKKDVLNRFANILTPFCFSANHEFKYCDSNILIQDGYVVTETNPHHRKAHLLKLTQTGRERYEKALATWSKAADNLASECSKAQLTSAMSTIRKLSKRISDLHKKQTLTQ